VTPVRRGPEPEALRDERFWRFARAMVRYLTTGEVPTEAELTGYQCAKEDLLAAQGNKCAYCEMRIREGDPVEHFRAKVLYWWLTWSWHNLFVSCSTCNDPGHKGHGFELFDAAARLEPGRQPPGGERPTLIDPNDASLNPVRCIEFRCVNGRWTPFPRGGDPRGDATIRAFGLDRGIIVDHYQDHVKDMGPQIDAVREAIRIGDIGDPEPVRRKWRILVGNAFYRTKVFHGLMYDVIAATFKEAERGVWGLDLREPGHDLPPDPPARDREVAAHAGLPDLLVLKVRALGNRHEAETRDEVVVDLCAHRAHTCAELAAILERSEGYTRAILKKLEELGRLCFTSPHYHPPSSTAAAG
jgi:hypothetical protein